MRVEKNEQSLLSANCITLSHVFTTVPEGVKHGRNTPWLFKYLYVRQRGERCVQYVRI